MHAYASPIRNPTPDQARQAAAVLLIAALVLGSIGFLASLDWMVVLAVFPFAASFYFGAKMEDGPEG